jgi:hypothetical protein
MFVLRSTHDRVIAQRDGARIVVDRQAREIARLQAELANRPVRGKGGKFTKREQGA